MISHGTALRVFCAWVVLLLAGPAHAQSLSGPEQVRDWNRQLAERSRSFADTGRLLRERSDALYRLMDSDPALARSLALSPDEIGFLRRNLPELADLVETAGEWQGRASAMVEDDFENHRSRTLWRLEAAGEPLQLYFAGAPPAITCERELKLRGIRLRDRVVADAAEVLPAAGADPCTTTGVQQSVVLLVSFPGQALPSNITTAFVQSAFFGGVGRTVSGFWNEASYGKTSAAGAVFGPFVLDQNYTCDQSEQIRIAAINAADATVDFTQYKRVFIVMPFPSHCAWGGFGTVGCWSNNSPSRGKFTASVSWLTTSSGMSNDGLVGTAAHEGGHNLGLHHASSLDYGTVPLGAPGTAGVYNEYGDPFSNMGQSANLGHYSAQHKLQLGWIDNVNNVKTVQANGTFTLNPIETSSSGLQAIRAQRGLAGDNWLWVEFRQPVSAYENFSPPDVFSGALIHYEDPGDPSYTELLDFNPVQTPNNFYHAALRAGRTWLDPYSSLSMTVNSATSSGLSVTLDYNGAVFASPAALSFTWQQGAEAPIPQNVALTSTGQSYSFTASASSTGNWLLLGSSNGSVPGALAVSVNPAGLFPGVYVGTVTVSTPGAPNSPIAIRVTLTAMPSPDAPQAVSVTPSTGNGSGRTFSFLFSDPVSYSRLQFAEVNIRDTTDLANSCYLRYDPAGGTVALQNDGATAWSAPLAMGGSGVLENSQCVVSGPFSTASGSGTNLTVSLAVSFKSAFVGDKYLFMRTQNASLTSGWWQRGTWTVDLQPGLVGVMPASGSGNAQVFSFLFSDPGVYTNLGELDVNISASTSSTASCSISYLRASNYAWLLNIGGSGSQSAGTLGGGGVAQNSQCALYMAGSSASGAGNNFTLKLSLAFLSAFAGDKIVNLAASNGTYGTGSQQRGTWKVTSGPLAVSVDPSSGTGSSTTLSFLFDDPGGYANLPWAEMNINSSSGTAGSCYLHYDRATNAVTLRNEADSGWSSPLTVGGNGVLENSQCVLRGIGSAASGSGNGLTIALALSFKGTFQGVRNVYMRTQNGQAVVTGWQQRGSWTVDATPATVSVTPASGSGSSQVFSSLFWDPGGYTNLQWLGVYISASAGPTTASCDISYYHGSNYAWLTDRAGTDSGVGTLLGTGGGTAQNSQCTLNGAASSVSSSGNNLTLSLSLSFQAAFAGIKNIYMSAQNSAGGGSWKQRGTWTVIIPPVPAITSLSPSFMIAGGGAFSLTVNGSGFVSNSVVQWNGATRPTTYVSATQLTTTITAADVASAGAAGVTAFTPAPGGGTSSAAGFNVTAAGTGLQFYPVTPCRIADTRSWAGMTGAFGPPSLAKSGTRSFPIPSSACGIPASAVAYALNITAVPTSGYLGWLTVWPTGQAQPVVSTLNAWDGLITANAAVVPAGTGGAISIYASDATDVFFDIDGYFAPPQASSYQFYPVTPCRVADTRSWAGFTGAFGPPSMAGNGTRAFPVLSSSCGIPSTASTYSLNVTAVPTTKYLGWLTVWPTGQPQPVVSTLNAWDGMVTANAAIVPAGTGGAISFYASDPTDVFFDIDGYFAPPLPAGLKFYPVNPCRVADTRSWAGFTGAYGPPSLPASGTRSFPFPSGPCGIPSTAAAYSVNITAVPTNKYLGWLSTWPAGTAQPVVSTLNAWDGLITANAAFVPAGASSAISIFVSDPADVFFDVNGYFAP